MDLQESRLAFADIVGCFILLILIFLILYVCSKFLDPNFLSLDLGMDPTGSPYAYPSAFGNFAPYSFTPSNTPGTPKEQGECGLVNLGNSCYMNSTLQCLAHIPELAAHFVTSSYKPHLNLQNPLGTKGEVAEAYASLVREMWCGQFVCVAPVDFRKAFVRHSPQFAGYQQHDAQEFLAALLDNLHEDLNQGSKLSSAHSPSSAASSRAPSTAAPAAQRLIRRESTSGTGAWESHTGLNQSIVVDLFQGQLKQSLHCTRCGHHSSSYETFQFLPLPLPQVNISLNVRLFPYLSTDADPATLACVVYTVRVPQTGCVGDVLRALRAVACIPEGTVLTPAGFSRGSSHGVSDRSASIRYLRLEAFAVYVGPPSLVSEEPAPPLNIVTFSSRRECHEYGSGQTWRRLEKFGVPYLYAFYGSKTMGELVAIGEMWVSMCFLRPPTAGAADPLGRIHLFGEPSAGVEYRFAPLDPYDGCLTCHQSTCIGCTPIVADNRSVFGSMGITFFAPDNVFDATLLTLTEDEPASYFARWWCYDSATYGLVGMPLVLGPEDGVGLRELTGVPSRDTLVFAKYEPDPLTLSDCMDEFMKEEILVDGDMWHCPKCECKVTATRRTSLYRVPDVLIIVLKRFAQVWGGHQVKNDASVRFPLCGLDLSPWVDDSTLGAHGSELCDAFALSNHSGALGAGHYSSFAKSAVSGSWYSLNDGSVNQSHLESQCVEGELTSSAAYVLMYRLRRSAQASVASVQLIREALPPPPEATPTLPPDSNPAVWAAGGPALPALDATVPPSAAAVPPPPPPAGEPPDSAPDPADRLDDTSTEAASGNLRRRLPRVGLP